MTFFLKTALVVALCALNQACAQQTKLSVEPLEPLILNGNQNGAVLDGLADAASLNYTRNDFYYTAALLNSGIGAGSASFYVQAVDKTAPLVSARADRAQNPASVIKLVTTFAALNTFGADYRWKNQLLSEGKPDANGVLNQPLYLRGSGDPQFVIEKIDALVQSMAASGVKQLNAPLFIDRSVFRAQNQDASSFDGEPSMPYNAQPDAALLNFRALIFKFDPDTQQVILTPWLMGYQLNNNVQWITGDCPSGGWKSTLSVNVSGYAATMGGKYYSGCGAQNWNFHAHQMSANDYAKGVFAGLFANEKGAVLPMLNVPNLEAVAPKTQQTIVWNAPVVQNGTIPNGARVIGEVESAPLTSILRDMNLFSNNVMARQIYLGLSAKQNGQGTLQNSETIVNQRLNERGLALNSLRMGNGSGLSRDTAISAADLGQMLVKAANDTAFVNTLAILGVDGTVKNRLLNTDMVGRGRLKTGTLNDVRAIAGYIDGKSGTRYAVVSIIQDANAQTEAGKMVHDLFLQWVGAQ